MSFANGFNKWLKEQGKEPCNPALSEALDESFAKTKAAMLDPDGPYVRGACELMEALIEARDGKPEKLNKLRAMAEETKRPHA
jgi:hypothetical protein